MERLTILHPAYNKRNPDPKKDYGVHGVELRMVLKGPKGAVQFVLFTNWMLPEVQQDLDLGTLMLASDGFTLPNYLSETPSGIREVDEGLESAKRMIGMSQPKGLDLLHLQCFYHPQPADLGYHSPVPMYKDQTPTSDSCEYLDGKPCYYDGSGLNAKPVYDILLKEGSEGVWKYLEDYYKRIFEGERGIIDN